MIFLCLLWKAIAQDHRCPLCRTNKGQKVCHFLVQDLDYVKLKHKRSCNHSFFHVQPEKKKFLKNCKSKQFYWFLLIGSWLFFLQGNPDGNKNRFRSFLGHSCHLRSRHTATHKTYLPICELSEVIFVLAPMFQSALAPGTFFSWTTPELLRLKRNFNFSILNDMYFEATEDPLKT